MDSAKLLFGAGSSVCQMLLIAAAATLLFLADGTEGIKITDIKVPSLVQAGDTIHLECLFNLQNSDKLYSVTWWREQKHFYQYVPTAESGKTKSKYDTMGIHVDEERSDMNTVVLRNVSLDTAGEYKCEVLSESPHFEKDFKSKELDVIDTPDRVPLITVDSKYYNPGDVLVANCTSTGSRPAPFIQWHINGRPVPSEYIHIVSETVSRNRLISLTSQLRLELAPDHFYDSRLKLTCVAEIKTVYHQSSDLTITVPGFKTAGPTQKYYINEGPSMKTEPYSWLLQMLFFLVGLRQ